MQCFLKNRDKGDFEKWFPYHNWILVLSLQLVLSTIWAVITPSIYQYITTPQSLPAELSQNTSTRTWPGLGGSDTDYAWALTFPPLCEFAVFPLALWMTRRVPFTVPLLIGVSLLVVSGTMYALSGDVWVLMISRGVMGMGGGLSIPALHTYMGEMGTMMDQVREKQGKKPRKFAVYIAFSFIMSGGFVIAFVFTSVVAQFPNVNPYHWPGWFMLSLAATQGLAILVFFWEPRPFTTPKIPRLTSLSSLKLSFKLTSQRSRFCSYVFLMCCGYISGQLYSLVFTLVTPILSYQFGFTVEYTSHFLIGVSVTFCLSSFIQLGMKMAKMDNRNVLGLLLLLALGGCLLLGDWQSFGHDPCTTTNITTIDDYDSSGALPTSENTSHSGHNATSEFLSVAEGSVIAREMCEALGHRCFWNPQSRVTGEPCNTCFPVCLSRAKSLCFYQFTLAVLLISIATPLLYVFTSVISSDMMPVRSQGSILTLVLSSGTVSRGVSPYWLVESYKLTGRHTYFAMTVTSGCLLVLLLSLVVLHKDLAPASRHKHVEQLSKTNDVSISMDLVNSHYKT